MKKNIITQGVNNMSQYEELLNGAIIEVDYNILIWLLKNMNEINTLSIQHYYNGNYIIKVDEITVERYRS